MADKRTAVATPRPSSQQQPPADALKGLGNAIGARIKVTTASQTLEGILFTACPTFNVLALDTTASPSAASSLTEPSDYHIIPINKIQNFQVVSLAKSGKDGSRDVLPPPIKLDTAKLKEREEVRIRKLKEEEAKRGKGVTAEAQALFNALDRMYAARWHNSDIVVDEAVIISPPYTADSCKAPKEKQQSLAHIRKIVEGERKKIADRSRGPSPLPRKGG